MTHRKSRGKAIVRIAAGVILVALAFVPITATAAPSYPTASWVINENALQGTRQWRIPKTAPTDIQGYADHVSAQVGDRIKLFVDTHAPQFRVTAFRLGYYDGLGGRRIWNSPWYGSVNQPQPSITSDTNKVVTGWTRTASFPIRPTWIQGAYLLKLVSSQGDQSYIPLVVRDDASTASLLVQLQTTTWQAYNAWGGTSLYEGTDGSYDNRARIVTFDRPYSGRGDAGILRALPFIAIAEGDGMDVTYWTDNDLHEQPGLVLKHNALISLNHDEYWSTSMRDGATTARANGVNLAFFGANAIFRHIRMKDSRLGPDRVIVDYKSASEDPLSGVDDSEVTVDWREPPLNDPESELLGGMYECYGVHADLVVGDASSWVYAGTGLGNGDVIQGGVAGEYDKIFPDEPTPRSIEVLAHSPLSCQGTSSYSDMTYYTASSDAGVFDVASTKWFGSISCAPPIDRARTCQPAAARITRNVLRAFADGPAGVAHPSRPNWSSFGYSLSQPMSP